MSLLMLGGAGLQTFGAISEGIAARNQGNLEDKISMSNAAISEQEGIEASNQASIEAERIRREGQRLIGSQRAAFAAGGVSGVTPQSVLMDTAREVELERLRTLRAGSTAYQQGLSRAQMERMSGKAAKQRGKRQALGSFLTAGGTALTGLYGFGKESKWWET